MSQALEIVSMSKTYRSNFGRRRVAALKEVSLEVKEGEVFGLLGLNGAGKTTLIRCALDLVRPSSGRVLLFGKPLLGDRWKQDVGYLPELFGVPGGMTAFQVLRFLGELSGLRGSDRATAIAGMLSMVGLSEAAHRKVEAYSKGMVLRLGIAQALLHKPRIVFLDEPTEGLDPLGRKMIRDLIMKLAFENVTVFLNSHLLSEIELVADRIAILHKGRIVMSGFLKDVVRGEEAGTPGKSTLEELFFEFLQNRHDEPNSHQTDDQ